MKKTLSLILALLMSVSCASGIFAAEGVDAEEVTAISEEAVDETPASPYQQALEFLNQYSIMIGNYEGDLMAEKAVERYEMALLMGRIMTGWVDNKKWEDYEANDSQFNDLKGTKAENFYGAMSYVNQKGVINGYPDGSFKPEQVVTYREALTMAVRALGYKPANWPWDYIEKAVELGLTKGIEGVAYTHTINRGVAAQIIYNTLFADGSKLALASIGTGFGWVDVLVTSSKIEDVNTAKYNGTVDYKVDAGYVTIQVINEDGTLDDTLYYVKADQIGGDAVHGDELLVGTPVSVLLSKDAKDNYVRVIKATPKAPVVYANRGLTDDAGEPIEKEINAYVKSVKVVSKYNKNILSDKLYDNTDKEIIVAAAGTNKYTEFDWNKTPYAFDWTTGDILLATKKDGKFVKDDDGNYTGYTIEWYYDAGHNKYFKIIDESGKLTDNKIGINILDDKDIAAIKDAIYEACKVEKETASAYKILDKVDAPLYATLNVYTTTAGKYATYETFNFGWMKQDEWKCGDCDAKKQAVYVNGAFVEVLDFDDCGHRDGAWYQDEYAPVLTADGKIESAYVVYNYNKTTKELKVLKTIEALSDNLTDVDTYYTTGIVRGYSLKKNTVTIGKTEYDLSQNFGAFNKANDDLKDNKWQAVLTDKFDELFNQFVKFYVLDGYVVDIQTVGADTDTFIVVESWAGTSNDGYVVVNGYNTDDCLYRQFRIAVYDGWNQGNRTYWGSITFTETLGGNNENMGHDLNSSAKYFSKGSIYTIKSYDKDNDVYFVDAYSTNVADPTIVTIKFENGYRLFSTIEKDGKLVETDKRAAAAVKTSAKDKYLVIGNNPASNDVGYMPIAVKTGAMKDASDLDINNAVLLVGAADKNVFILAYDTRWGGGNTVITGIDFNSRNGLVMVLDAKVLEKYYNGADNADKYLTGATTYNDILVFDLLTAKVDVVAYGVNKKVVEGGVYVTYKAEDGTVLGERVGTGRKWNFVINQIANLSGDDTTVERNVEIDAKWITDNSKKDLVSADYLSNNALLPELIFSNNAKIKGLVNNLDAVLVTEENGSVSKVETLNKDKWNDLAKTYDMTSVTGDVVTKKIEESAKYDVTIYVVLNDLAKIADGSVKVVAANKAVVADNASIVPSATVTSKVKTVDDHKVVTATVSEIALKWDIENKDYYTADELKAFAFDTAELKHGDIKVSYRARGAEVVDYDDDGNPVYSIDTDTREMCNYPADVINATAAVRPSADGNWYENVKDLDAKKAADSISFKLVDTAVISADVYNEWTGDKYEDVYRYSDRAVVTVEVLNGKEAVPEGSPEGTVGADIVLTATIALSINAEGNVAVEILSIANGTTSYSTVAVD